MVFFDGEYDVAVIGAGHAGIEAALASARLGSSTVVFTISLDFVGNMPCNPSIGGSSKGHLVREIDALGGEMGKAADKNTIHSRVLGRGKGPGVQSLRAQIDRRAYGAHMKNVLENEKNLDLKQAEIVNLEKTGGVFNLYTSLGAKYAAKAVIIASGTFLKGKIYVGDKAFYSGPDGIFPSMSLSASLTKLGVPLRRFKTGTPPRVNKNSINFDVLEKQEGDKKVLPFSFSTKVPPENKALCHIAYTNDESKKIILDNISRSPLYSGKIKGVGPRYCPSIEDKIVRFPDKERHQLFIEPCGLNTNEIYISGFSSSMPIDVQDAALRTVKGFENAKIERFAYAIEYDCTDPLALKHTLEFKDIEGLYGAGQFNGSSGYEEAAAQGLAAGINASLKIKGGKPLILDRAGSYIGVLIDDLVTKGCDEPYRMMTSRSEYRLSLRQDNADLRLTEIGRDTGLISNDRYNDFLKKKEEIALEKKRAYSTTFPPSKEINEILSSLGTAPLTTGAKLSDLLKRPRVNYGALTPADKERPRYPEEVFEEVEIDLKYEGYIKREKSKIDEMRRLESKKIPLDTDYNNIAGLRLEAREKLSKARPENIGAAGRVPGVSPADISVLLIYLQKISKN